MSLFVVDVEADGPYPGGYSMVCFGIAKVMKSKIDTFYSELLQPISDEWIPEALAVSGFTRQQMEMQGKFNMNVMPEAIKWVNDHSKGKPVFISDNNAFDWQFWNYYAHRYGGSNPFGFSCRRIGDLYAGLEHDFFAASKWKKFRKTSHDHNPVNDAIGNVEAILTIAEKHSLRIPLE
jgi:hypothetical protein